MNNSPKISESMLIFIIAAVQFINVLDFMMVMPLGPDLAIALDIPTSHIGWIGGVYTFSAAISGLLCSIFLDNYDRRKILLVSLFGLLVATMLCALSWNFASIMFFRAVAGAFGGPLFSIVTAIISDNVAPQKRGVAIAKVMSAFSIASVFGVPFGLEAARHFGWQSPFIIVGVAAMVILLFAYLKLPSQNTFIQKMDVRRRAGIILANLKRPLYMGSFAFMGLGIMSGSMIIPNISAHLQFTLGYSRDSLWLLYFYGGLFSLVAIGIGGRMVDKISSTKVAIFSNVIVIFSLAFGYIYYEPYMNLFVKHPQLAVTIIFVLFMLGMASRNVAGQTLSSKVPLPTERAGYSSLQHSIINICQSVGAFMASNLLVQGEGLKLIGIEKVAALSIIISLIALFLLCFVERKMKTHTAN